jgi:hypothetical protein
MANAAIISDLVPNRKQARDQDAEASIPLKIWVGWLSFNRPARIDHSGGFRWHARKGTADHAFNDRIHHLAKLAAIEFGWFPAVLCKTPGESP